ncbi:hypothetical protein [Amycolatopsis sp. NPDC051372]|uniref:hypothetical protein n=1 Tax=Amycolatopsis sp. NPDC051372 TaxID=3155669 RepID=UPI0034458222
MIATARRPETLADLPVDQRLRLDVTDQESVDAAIREAGESDVVVSNAGESVRAPLESVPLDEGCSSSTPSARCGWCRAPCRPCARGSGRCGPAC